MKINWRIGLLGVLGLCVATVGCLEQFDPTDDWQKFRQERMNANQAAVLLAEDGTIPQPQTDDQDQQIAANPVERAYSQFCASCHGQNGGGDGPASTSDPKPRNFQAWDYSDIPSDYDVDSYIAKVIREGGASVGKSALMAPWGGVLDDSTIAGLVEKIKGFKTN